MNHFFRSSNRFRAAQLERMESRRCMTASVGWDGPGLGEASLTYYVDSVPANLGLDSAAVKTALDTALSTWSSAADINFTPTNRPNQPRSIDFTFRSIDGSGGTLAQAYFPGDVNRGSIAGDVQFDIAENWEIGNGRGNSAFDLLYVAVHEIGHALGLDHLHGAGSVMADRVGPGQHFTKLAALDEAAIRQLYSAGDVDRAPPVANSPMPSADPDPPVPAPTPTPPLPNPGMNPWGRPTMRFWSVWLWRWTYFNHWRMRGGLQVEGATSDEAPEECDPLARGTVFNLR
jgi:hypothetical protein